MAMASSSTRLSLSSSSSLIDGKAPRQSAAPSPQCVSLPALPRSPVPSQNRSQNRESWKNNAYYRTVARNVVTMATGDTSAEVATTEFSDIVKPVQEAWDKLEDKYAVTSLALAVVVALWGSTGIISAIDRLPLVPGILELVGIGYTGWFAYKNLVFKPEREALIQKIEDAYNDIIGSS